MTELEQFISGYIEAALWSSTDESDEQGGEPLDKNYDRSDLSAESLESIERDCAKFIEANKLDIDEFVSLSPRGSSDGGPWELAGHCFWLNRCGHGTGFWDRDVGAVGDRLSDACKKFKESYLVVGNDGKIHVD